MAIPSQLTNAITSFAAIDANRDGRIDRSEAEAFSGLLDGFDGYDQDRDGKLSLPELNDDVDALNNGGLLLTADEEAAQDSAIQDFFSAIYFLYLSKMQDVVGQIKDDLDDF